VPSWERLAAATEAGGIGFFGELRPRGAESFPSHLEPRVAETAAAQGWLLAYLNVRFDQGPVYANLVVVTERAAVHALAGDTAQRRGGRVRGGDLRVDPDPRLALAGRPASQPSDRAPRNAVHRLPHFAAATGSARRVTSDPVFIGERPLTLRDVRLAASATPP